MRMRELCCDLPIRHEDQEICWTLQLMDGDASHWPDEQLVQYSLVPPPAHLTDWMLFVAEFKTWWNDPYKSEKALDRILKGRVVQRTSVNDYNDQFNEALSLIMETGANAAILRSYETGLKPAVRNAAIVTPIANLNISFHDRQMLMIRLDETLMHPRTPMNPTTQRRYVINNPVNSLPSSQPSRSSRQERRPDKECPGLVDQVKKGHTVEKSPRRAESRLAQPTCTCKGYHSGGQERRPPFRSEHPSGSLEKIYTPFMVLQTTNNNRKSWWPSHPVNPLVWDLILFEAQ